MQWTVHSEDGPCRVNHAAVSVKDRYVFSFGGFYSGDEYSQLEKIDVHIFDLSNFFLFLFFLTLYLYMRVAT